MKRSLKETLKYAPNNQVAVTVTNEPTTDRATGEYGFKQEVTVKVKIPFGSDKLAFANEDDIRAFIDDIVLEDSQQELPL